VESSLILSLNSGTNRPMDNGWQLQFFTRSMLMKTMLTLLLSGMIFPITLIVLVEMVELIKVKNVMMEQ